MRYALIADIHGNLPALRAVFSDYYDYPSASQRKDGHNYEIQGNLF